MTHHTTEAIDKALAIYDAAARAMEPSERAIEVIRDEISRGMPTCSKVPRFTKADPECTCTICLTIRLIGRDLLRAGRFQELSDLANAIGISRGPLPSFLLRDLPNREPWAPGRR